MSSCIVILRRPSACLRRYYRNWKLDLTVIYEERPGKVVLVLLAILAYRTKPHRPLNAQKTEQECETRIPSAGLVHNAVTAKDVGRSVHLRPWRRCQQGDDDD